MGAFLGVLPSEASPIDSDFLVINNTPESSLHFNPKQSRLLVFGIDKQTHLNYQNRSLGNTVKLDALEVALTFLKQHNIDYEIHTASDHHDQCTYTGMKTVLESNASKVGKEGILIVFFGGHGISDSNQKWALVPADFDLTSDTYITASDLTQCMTRASCQAKYVLLILDCCYSGKIGTDITKGVAHHSDDLLSNVYVLASGTALQSSFGVGILRHSIFSYFLKRSLINNCLPSNVLLPDGGVLPLMDIFKECKTCCEALSSLMLSLDKRSGNKLRVCESVPSLSFFSPQVEEGGEEIDFEPSAGRLNFVMQLLAQHRCPKPSPSLHQLTFQWLRRLIQSLPNPLSTLNDRGMFDDSDDNGRVLIAVIGLIMQSIAYIELVHNGDTLHIPHIFLVAFVHTVATIDSIHPGLNVKLEYMIQVWPLYHDVLVKNNIDDTLLNELYSDMNSLK